MTESVCNVYDLIYPSPITLQEISTIVVVVELWREEICTQLESKRLQGLDLKNNIQLKNALPSLPSTIYRLLEEYVDTFRKSILSWQKYHHDHVFDDFGLMNVISRFDDFAWDWDGTIHEERTAKRMMMCDRLTQDEKFKIACLYCFEDDIKQIWPSVSETKDLDKIYFDTRPEQYYWISYLRNELHKIPNPHNAPIDELMVFNSRGRDWVWKHRSCAMYFWNRLTSDRLPQIDVHLVRPVFHECVVFARFILPKLNEHQLNIFVGENGSHLMWYLLKYGSKPVLVLPTWKYIRSRINDFNFLHLIIILLLEETYCRTSLYSRSVADSFSEIWKSVPEHLKRRVLNCVLNSNFESMREWNINRRMIFLITVLRDATFEERNAYWHSNWRNVISRAPPVQDLIVMIKLSFRNENEITLFKENVLSMYKNIAEGCALLLKHGLFEELNDFLSVCCLDEQKRKELKRRLLMSNYVGENSIFTIKAFRNNKSLNEFIDDAFHDAADLGVEFRNHLRSSPVTENCLLECIRYGYFDVLVEFVDTFFPDEQVVVPLKVRLFEHFKERLIAGDILYIDDDKLAGFLFWLLGSEDEVIRFKQSIRVDKVFCTMMQQVEFRRIACYVGDDFKLVFPQNVIGFLLWYFNKNEDEVEKFTKPILNDIIESLVPRKRRRIA